MNDFAFWPLGGSKVGLNTRECGSIKQTICNRAIHRSVVVTVVVWVRIYYITHNFAMGPCYASHLELYLCIGHSIVYADAHAHVLI